MLLPTMSNQPSRLELSPMAGAALHKDDAMGADTTPPRRPASADSWGAGSAGDGGGEGDGPMPAVQRQPSLVEAKVSSDRPGRASNASSCSPMFVQPTDYEAWDSEEISALSSAPSAAGPRANTG